MGSARLRFSGEVKEIPAPPPPNQPLEGLPSELQGVPEGVLIQMLTPPGVLSIPGIPSLVGNPQQPSPTQSGAPPDSKRDRQDTSQPAATTPPAPIPAGPQMNPPSTPPGASPSQQPGGTSTPQGMPTGHQTVVVGPDGKEVIGVSTDHVSLVGARIPYAVAVQVGTTAIATAVAVSAANALSSALHSAIDSAMTRMSANTTTVNANPITKLKGVFVDTRPKIVVRRVVKPGGGELVMFEAFDGHYTSTLLETKDLEKGKISIADIKEVLQTFDPNWRVNVSVRIDSEIANYLDSDERALWKRYFKGYSRLFRGVR